MAKFGDLPEECVHQVFSYLNPWESLACRGVSSSWRNRLLGCAAFTCSFSSNNYSGTHAINGVWIKGHRDKYAENSEDELPRVDMSSQKKGRRKLPFAWRTIGQLPEPLVLSTRTQLFNERPLQVHAEGPTVAFRMEERGNVMIWDTIDVSLSSCLVTRTVSVRPRPNAAGVLRQKRIKPLLKRVLLRADLGSVFHLQRLSLCGCSLLQELYLPPNLQALDVSSCSNLTRITFSRGHRGKLQSLNLRGCRVLEAQDRTRLFGAATGDVMRHIQDIDLSSTKRINPIILADALRLAQSLETVSLRHVATDATMRALADSEAAKTSINLVDISFSEDVKDEACEMFVHAAVFLERLNLRGCTSISSTLYNSIPIRLCNRRGGGDGTSNGSTVSSSSLLNQSRRKGDVVFQFTKESR